MKKYILANERFRTRINLRDYDDTIANAVLDVMGGDEVTVCVGNDGYYMDFDPTEEEENRIKEIIEDSYLSMYRANDGSIFTSIEVPSEFD